MPGEIGRLIKDYGVERVLMAIPSAPRARRSDILHGLEQLKVSVQTIPGMADVVACWAFDPDGFMTTGTQHGAMLTTRDRGLRQRMSADKDQDKRWSVVYDAAVPEGGRWKPEGSHPD